MIRKNKHFLSEEHSQVGEAKFVCTSAVFLDRLHFFVVAFCLVSFKFFDAKVCKTLMKSSLEMVESQESQCNLNSQQNLLASVVSFHV